MRLRPYQTEALTAVANAWARGVQRPAVVLPTGMGKTVIFAHLAIPGTVILVHRDELITQTLDKLAAIAPNLDVGVIKAERNDLYAEVIVASVQTLSRPNRLIDLIQARMTYLGDHAPISRVIVDEAHHAAADTYRYVLDQLGCFDAPSYHLAGKTSAVGFTATMSREDDRALGDIWQEVVYTKDILYGIRGDYLVDVRGQQVRVDGLDLSRVRKTRGDLAEKQLGAALEAAQAGRAVADAYREYAGDRQGILFAPTVATAESMADDMAAIGIEAATVVGTTPIETRRLMYKHYRAGDLQVISSVGVLTEGFDMPQAEIAVIARATTSRALYTQMIGRVLRPWPGKRDALVLDVTGATGRHRLASLVDLSAAVSKMEPGQSLHEAAQQRERAAKRSFVQVDREVDLFAASRSAWLQTRAGVWFIPTREKTVFLWPDDDGEHFTIGEVHPYGRQRADKVREHLPLDYAMSLAEEHAYTLDPSVSRKTAAWRRNPEVSDKQRAEAAKLRIDPAGKTRSQLSNEISIAYASRVLDRKKKS